MKATILALVALAAGIAAGVFSVQMQLPGGPSPVARLLTTASSSGNAALTGTIGPVVRIIGGEEYNFGTMDRFTEGTHEFVVRNEGDAPLILEKGQTTCKCTGFELGSKEIGPKEEAIITLEWTAKTDDALFSQSAEIKTNDPNRPTVKLLVEGMVTDALRAERPELSLGSVSVADPTVGRMRVYGYIDQPLEIVDHEWTSGRVAEFMEVEFRQLTEEELQSETRAKSGVLMTITVKPGLPLGRLTQTIRLTTNVADAPPVEVPIVGRVAGDINIVGPRYNANNGILSLGLVERPVGAKSTLQILIKGEHRDNTELTIATVEPQDSLKATLGEPNREAKIISVPLTIEVPPGATPISRIGTGDIPPGRIVIETNHPTVKKLEIEVSFAVNP